MSNTFKFVNAYQFLGSPIKYNDRNKTLDNCKHHGQGKVDFITKYLIPQYNNIIYIDDDKKEHFEISSQLYQQQHVNQFVGELGTMIAPMYTYSSGNYFFIDTLTKDGNGMTNLEIWKINEIVKRIKGGGPPLTTNNTDSLHDNLLYGTGPFDNVSEDDDIEFVGGYLKSAQEFDSPSYYDKYEYYKQIYLDLKYHPE